MPLSESDLGHPTAGHTLIAVLDTCARTGWIALALMLHAAICICLCSGWTQLAMAAVIVPGLATQYLSTRLALDAHLFRALYRSDTSPALFDRALGHLLGRATDPTTSRSMASRWRGTQRLVRRFLACFTIELALWLLALALQWIPA